MDLPRTILELGRLFSSEEKCREYLFRARWPHGFVCPRCGGNRYSQVSTRPRQVRCQSCWHQVSLTARTVIERSKRPLAEWFAGAYMMATMRPGISAAEFRRQVAIPSYECAFQVLHKLRAAAGQREKQKLSGSVEVDECYVGGEHPGKRGRGAAGKALVVGAVEVRGRASGRVRLRKIERASQETLRAFLSDHVEPGTTVSTDGFVGYDRIEAVGYRHDVVIQSEEQKEAEKWLPHVHRAFGNLKVWLNGTHHGVSPKHLQAYLNEFCFRTNRRSKPVQAFGTLLGLAAQRDGPTYERLYRVGSRSGWRHPNPLGVEAEAV